MSITAHCLIRNEEVFVGYAIKSVINFVESVLVFDTGSTDRTADVVRDLQLLYPGKIIFEEKGDCDKKRHTELRQEMIERTRTEWFMILDGDEVWSERAIKEAKAAIDSGIFDGIKTRFYECVGDIYHQSRKESYVTGRFVKNGDVSWLGNFNKDDFYTKKGMEFFKEKNIYLLQNKYWHLTHLLRSSKDNNDYSSGGRRIDKRILTYFIIGRRIEENIPEVFKDADLGLSPVKSFLFFILWVINKIKILYQSF